MVLSISELRGLQLKTIEFNKPKALASKMQNIPIPHLHPIFLMYHQNLSPNVKWQNEMWGEEKKPFVLSQKHYSITNTMSIL